MERVLIAYAGSAGELALVVGEQLCRAGLGVDVRCCSAAGAPDHYQAVVIGSSILGGGRAPDATAYLSRHRAALAERRLWLFECCEPGEPAVAGSPVGFVPVRFSAGDFHGARDWGFALGCEIRPLTSALPALT